MPATSIAASANTSAATPNPPVDYAVAMWLGTPKEELEKGLREGYIRHPGVAFQSWTEQRGADDPLTSLSAVAPDAPAQGAQGDTSALDLRLRIETLLRRIDPALEPQTFSEAWNEAGASEPDRASRLIDFLAVSLNAQRDAAAPEVELSAIEQAVDRFEGAARFIRLEGMTGRELEQLAQGESGARRALAEHRPWALTGDPALAGLGDVAGRFDRFDRDSGEQLLSDAWLGDRARHAAWRSAQRSGDELSVAGEGWRFVDRVAGEDVSIELSGATDAPVNQVIFAKDGGDRVNGAQATDRIHGGTGDDILRGRAGDDLLEGGSGEDVLQGGSGRDLLVGQRGDDELDGGAGHDRLEGGSGDDELAGGRGDDVLRGGQGLDTYRFEIGDGDDRIEDDGGVVLVDDVAVSGTMRASGDGWASTDGRFNLALENATDGEGTLVIRAAGGDASAVQSSIRIAGWKAGAFGITLASAEDPEARDGDEVVAEPESASASASGDGNGSEAPMAARSANAGDVGLLPDPLEALGLVDTVSVASALQEWSPPAPPDVGEVLGSAPIGVTAAELGDALAGLSGDAEADSGAGFVSLESLLAPSPPRPAEATTRPPPDLTLRSPS